MTKELNDAENYNVEEKDIDNLTQTDLIGLLDIEGVKESGIFTEGFQSLFGGYVDYANEVLVNRAVEDLYDGLKPVQRYALWYLYQQKGNEMQKSEAVASGVLKYHPHNADSAYESLCKMTDTNGTFNVPLLKGKGTLGRKFSNGSPAAKRYTGVKLHDYAKEMFSMMDGIDMVWNFDTTAKMPQVLPTSFPYILCKYADGIAVGFSTNSPSFTVNDVCDLVEENIKNGQCSTVIIPDFSTGGYIVPSEKELVKLMRTGKGKFITRGRVEIDGKNIDIVEVPQGVTIEKIIKEIEKNPIQGIAPGGIADLTDKTGCRLRITCRAKHRVEEVLLELYNKTSLQRNFNSNLLAIENKKLVITGVWGIVDRWVKWRRQVITRQLQLDLADAKHKGRMVKGFVDLLSIEGAREEIIEIVTKKSDGEAIKRIQELIDVDVDVAQWIIQRRLNQFRNDSKYIAQYDNLMLEIDSLEKSLANVDSVILADMDRVRRTIGNNIPRKTEISYTTYKFLKDVKDDVEEVVTPCYYEIKNGFLRKLYSEPKASEDSFIIKGLSNSIIVTLSDAGEIFRIYGNELEYSSYGDLGVFIPTYAGLTNAHEVNVIWGTVADGTKHVLTYSDGFVGLLDTEEFLGGAIKSKYLKNGISAHADKLTDVREYHPNSAILVVTHYNEFSLVYLDSIKMKSRTARTRVWKSTELYDSAIIPVSELSRRIPNYETLLTLKPVPYAGEMNLYGEIGVEEENSEELVETV